MYVALYEPKYGILLLSIYIYMIYLYHYLE